LEPLRSAGFEIVNIDIRDDQGVDMVGDPSDDAFLNELKNKGFSFSDLANLLEHLEDRHPFITACSDMIAPGSVMLVSVSYSYPYHPAPIETLYRSSPEELFVEFHSLVPLKNGILCDRIFLTNNYLIF
jgi:hypothetical protein